MSRLFPHADYAEDQPLHRTILAAHVAARAATTGALAGAAVHGVRALLPKRAATTTTATTSAPAALRLLRASGTGVAWATALAGLYLGARMARWEPIESQDRAWRLMENQGQLETDDWTVAGTVAGVAAATALASSGGGGGGLGAGMRLLGWRGLLGAAGSGSVVGMVGYLGWRYGVKKGQREAVAL
ncbi:hypothetical protein RB595_006730 [Gaeumannomyces hyphopodioides]